MKAIYKKKIRGYSALSRFLLDVKESVREVKKESIEGLPKDKYTYSKTAIIESKPNYDFVRIESNHAVYSIYRIV